ncbi:MAG: ABC transporter permease [Planctomycetes bacterium]|nr:ABC transporter permease [Planctomycetota bacterium]MCB9825746.1 ABC transporter permease [Planctomycetota bacterium]MCB9830005.1 ABC transporter permease [Planctomycetota bacterium]
MHRRGPVAHALESLGGATLGLVSFIGGTGLLLRESAAHGLKEAWRRTPIAARVFRTQAVRSGPRSLPVVILVNLFVGMILALIGGRILISLGFKEYVGRLMGIGMVLELGPLLTAIIMTGYIGAAYTAEIASMVVSEEITALETMALKPARLVAAPRILAVTLMVPCVTLVGDVIGIYGGRLVAGGVLEIGANTYWEQVWMQLTTENIRDGFVKSIVFGLLVGLVGCYKGFRARGGAEGVGRATTSSVVTAIVAILIADGILNYLMLFRL